MATIDEWKNILKKVDTSALKENIWCIEHLYQMPEIRDTHQRSGFFYLAELMKEELVARGC